MSYKTGAELTEEARAQIREVSPKEVKAMLDSGDDVVYLDVREPNEYAGGRLPNALHIPLSQLKDRAAEITKHVARPVIVYCDRGMRSSAATSALERLGFTRVQSLRGGVRAWKEAGLPLAK